MIVRSRIAAQLGLALCVCSLLKQPAAAFCGFYVAGASSQLYANATMVVLMRDGTKTVLSMQNNYDGPPEDFALVIPVPSVLTQDMVKTLPREVFARVDAQGAPRLVEYWEVDPCIQPTDSEGGQSAASAGKSGASAGGVRVEASFAVGEYDIVILSADDSSSLAGWLTDNQYHIPDGAETVLEPYVASGTKFFVAKVDPARVTFNEGQAALSPLRFYYDSQEFSLPIRLGLLNSRGQQDLIINILAPDRYQVSNRSNVTIPTNIRVQEQVRDDFPGFYEALFSRALEKNPNAVVTEYAWSWNNCDPCPPSGMMMTPQDLATLGADVTRGAAGSGGSGGGGGKSGTGGASASTKTGPAINPFATNYSLTRLHYRYNGADLRDDLIFERASPLLGGRGIPDRTGQLSMDVTENAGVNSFQGRYVILHPWAKALQCTHAQRGIWGGPPDKSAQPSTMSTRNTALTGAPPQAGALPALLAQSLSSLDVKADRPLDPVASTIEAPSSGCSCNLASRAARGTSFLPPLAAGWFALWLSGARLRTRRARASCSSKKNTNMEERHAD